MKDMIRSKTFWGGIAAVATGVGLVISGNIPEGLNTIASGLLAIFLRDGIRRSNAAGKE